MDNWKIDSETVAAVARLAVALIVTLMAMFGVQIDGDAIENAVNKVLDKGLRTADNMSEGCICLGCTAMGDAILAEI